MRWNVRPPPGRGSMPILDRLHHGIFSSGSSRLKTPTAVAESHCDRRSPLRPQFREGWRKHVPVDRQEATSSSDVASASPIYVWASRVETLLASAANFDLLNEDDQAALHALSGGSTRESAAAARILLWLSLSGQGANLTTSCDRSGPAADAALSSGMF
jgi:hypothetical protein